MSHFTRVSTQIVERPHLIQALQDLGYSPEVGTVEIRGFAGNRTAVEVRVPTQNPEYDIGFQKTGDVYELVADWWGIRDISQEQFLHQVTQRYAYRSARAKLEEQGFALVSEETQAGGQIHLVLRRVV